MDDDRDDLRLHRRLTQACEEWTASGGDGEPPDPPRDATLLWEGARLLLAESWVQANRTDLSAREEQFLASSRYAMDSAERERRRRRFVLTALTAVAMLLAAGLAWFGFQSLEQARLLESRGLAGLARSHFATDPQLGVLLAHEALQRGRNDETEATLRESLLEARLIQRVPYTDTSMLRAVFSSDQRYVATLSGDNKVKVRSLDTGITTAVLPAADGVTALEFVPGESGVLATGHQSGAVRLWDVATGSQRYEFQSFDPGTLVTSLAFSPDGKRMATGGYDFRVRLWNVDQEGSVVFPPSADSVDPVFPFAMTFNPQGTYLAIGSYNGMMRIVDMMLKDATPSWQGHEDLIYDLAFAPDGSSLASVSSDAKLKVWRTTDLAMTPLPVQQQTSKNTLMSVAYSANGRCVAAGGFAQVVIVWNLANGALMNLLGGNQAQYAVSFSGDSLTDTSAAPPAQGRLRDDDCGNHLLSTGEDGSLLTWNIGPTAEYAALTGHRHGVNAIAMDPGQTWQATADEGGAVLIWPSVWTEGTTPNPRRLQLHSASISDLAVSADGRYLVTASLDGTAKVVNTKTWAEVATTQPVTEAAGQPVSLSSIVFTPTQGEAATFAATQSDGAISLWDAATGRLIRRWSLGSVSKSSVNAVAFTHDGKRMLIGSDDGTAVLLEIAAPEALHSFDHNGSRVYSVAFTPDERFAITGDQAGRVHFWSLETWAEVKVIKVHHAPVGALEFSPDNLWFVSASMDGRAFLWNTAQQVPLKPFLGASDALTDARFATANGLSVVITTSVDGTVRAYLVYPDDLLQFAADRMRSVRSLSGDECRLYFRLDACPS